MNALSAGARGAVLAAFEKNFRERSELGASVSIWQGGEEIVCLAQGHADRERTRDWDVETLVPVWSATKGPAALACLLALDEAKLPLESPVRELWPRFAAAGKAQVTFAQVLSHTAGLYALDETVPILDHDAVVAALETQAPLHPPGAQPAYHARTFGFLLEEIVRRATGAESLGEYFHARVGAPMQLDFWMGLPHDQFHRVARLYPGRVRAGSAEDPFLRAAATRGTATHRAFTSPAGLGAIQDMNQPETWRLGLPSMGGIGSARALARFYAMLANGGRWGGEDLVPDWCLQALSKIHSQGADVVLCTETAFGAGVMKDPVDETGLKKRAVFGSDAMAFGHPGAGGSLAFADPGRGVGFAYVMNQMEPGALPTEKALDLVRAMEC